MQKVHFRLTSVAQKRCCLSSLLEPRVTFAANGKREFVPRDQVFPVSCCEILNLNLTFALFRKRDSKYLCSVSLRCLWTNLHVCLIDWNVSIFILSFLGHKKTSSPCFMFRCFRAAKCGKWARNLSLLRLKSNWVYNMFYIKIWIFALSRSFQCVCR